MALPPSRTSDSAPGIFPSPVLHRTLHAEIPCVVSASGSYLTLSTGRRILDSTGGAAVSCIGHCDPRVVSAITKQASTLCYSNSILFTSAASEEAAKVVLDTCGEPGKNARMFFVCSGSEANEAALKLARQYFYEKEGKDTKREWFIARRDSYHGATLGALAVSGHVSRRAKVLSLLNPKVSFVSPCNAYRGMKDGETEADYVARLAAELDAEFQRLGPEKVIAFIAEPVVGAALACVPPVEGYFKAMKAVCDKYGALLILDEVMTGMGRTGTMHAWMQEGIVPDLQCIGKGLGGGYVPAASVIAYGRVVEELGKGSGAFAHGQTYQAHPMSCAAITAVQRIIQEDNLVENVKIMGKLLGELLHSALDDHPHVGNVRGRGLFWGIEFVADKATKEPFPVSENISMKVHQAALDLGISVYPAGGVAGDGVGDAVLLAPMYNCTEEDIREIVKVTKEAVEQVFQK